MLSNARERLNGMIVITYQINKPSPIVKEANIPALTAAPSAVREVLHQLIAKYSPQIIIIKGTTINTNNSNIVRYDEGISWNISISSEGTNLNTDAGNIDRGNNT